MLNCSKFDSSITVVSSVVAKKYILIWYQFLEFSRNKYFLYKYCLMTTIKKRSEFGNALYYVRSYNKAIHHVL